MNQQIKALVVAISAAFLSTGCYASAGATSVAYVETTEAPIVIDVQTYPHSYYEGHVVYFYQDRWYYQDGPRWAYYREEPPILYRQRGYVQQAPDARHEHAEHAEQQRREYEQQERAQRDRQQHEAQEHAQQERQQREAQEHAQLERQQHEAEESRERRERNEHATPIERRRAKPLPAPRTPDPKQNPRRVKKP